MNLKFHALVLLGIIVIMFAAWQIMVQAPKAPAQQAVQQSPYKVIVVSASYGLNCKSLESETKNPLLVKNNALEALQKECSGKPTCSVSVSADVVKKDPAPECGTKELVVEYRCFNVDKLRDITVVDGNTLEIDCENRL